MSKELINKLGIAQGVNEIIALTKQIPADGDITADDALVFELKCWHLKTKLTDMLTRARRYELTKKQERDNILIDIGAEEGAPNSAVGKEQYAKADDRWRKLQDEAKAAEVLREYIQNKKDDFEQAIYVMRSQAQNRSRDQKSMPQET